MGTHILKYTDAHRCTQHYYTNFITTLLLLVGYKRDTYLYEFPVCVCFLSNNSKVSPDTRRFYAFRTKAVIVIYGAQNAKEAPKKKSQKKRKTGLFIVGEIVSSYFWVSYLCVV